ncbi:MAG TPA: single-stranded-DNA-specific exonuclease RecJ [Phycisphaerales bacterium]|nr:single-stranded-DNA-specific exonuclease RecJ [Phycisphaerales bacterium]
MADVQRGLLKRWMPRGMSLGTGVAGGGTLVERVMAARGLAERRAAEAFFDVRLSQLHDPSLMAGLDRAATRIMEEVAAGGPVVIYGDYDVDGVTGTAILMHTIRSVRPDADVSWYIPHRVEEGYGLNREAIEQIAASCIERGARVGRRGLIVSVDCGVTAVGPAIAARDAGVDLIITDHHNGPSAVEDLPCAYAVVHPRRPDSAYPFGELSGAGVAYKLAWRLATLASGSSKVNERLRQVLIELLALAALGTIADVVPLVGENRVLAKHGLGRIKNSPIVGLRALVEASGLAGDEVDAQGVGFKLAPRLNACGRLGHANEAVELLTTDDAARAHEIAEGLTNTNNERRRVEHEIFERACSLAEAAGMHREDRRAIVLAEVGWHTGVVGIVCSRLVEKYGRPCILLGRDGEVCHGSGRSVEGFSLHAALEECREHLMQFGGHDMAAGMRVEAGKLNAFVDAFVNIANERIAVEQLGGVVHFDADASLEELSVEVVKQLGRMEPFGRDNPPVCLRVCGLRIVEAPRLLGGTGKHLALRVADEHGRWSRLVAWGWGERAGELRVGHRIDAVVTPKVSTFQGERVEPVIEDVRVHR